MAKFGKRNILHCSIALLTLSVSSCSQGSEKLRDELDLLQRQQPTKSRDQELIYLQGVPKDFETHIFVADEQGAARAQQLIEIYKILEAGPTIEKVRKYVSDDYIQHSTMLPDGPQPLAMLFASSAKQYPVKIDVHKVAVVGDFGMAHVNFRNLSTEDPADLGIAAVDMYYWGEDGKIVEHWDTLQNVPTHSANSNTMFLLLSEGGK
ncbi:MAG: nuclear transport factor 2 family protein [Pseudomonadota bacterium]